MKYIRTKDGRISYLSSEPNEEITNYEIITSKGTLTYRREDEVIKIANTIEELCDEYILKRSDESKPRVLNKDNIDYYKNFNKEGGPEYSYSIELFAAIWATDVHGNILLKPVAKLNKEGELELL